MAPTKETRKKERKKNSFLLLSVSKRRFQSFVKNRMSNVSRLTLSPARTRYLSILAIDKDILSQRKYSLAKYRGTNLFLLLYFTLISFIDTHPTHGKMPRSHTASSIVSSYVAKGLTCREPNQPPPLPSVRFNRSSSHTRRRARGFCAQVRNIAWQRAARGPRPKLRGWRLLRRGCARVRFAFACVA